MKNLNYRPFERNKFFYGKLLTVADFELEQKYMNDKRRFLSRYLFGTGVICGLNTYSVDDGSVMIEAGAAIDSTGREIVLNESILRKLSGIDGYDATSGSVLYLCIEYAEEPHDPVYAIARTLGDTAESASEFSRVRESFRLFVTDKEPDPEPYSLIDDFVSRKTIFSARDITVTQSVPRTVSALRPFSLSVDIEKHTAGRDLSFEYTIDSPYFNTSDGSNAIRVCFNDTPEGLPDRYRLTYTLIPPGGAGAEARMSVSPQSFRFKAREDVSAPKEAVDFDINVIRRDLPEIVKEKYFSVSMDEASGSSRNKPLYLARIGIFRSNAAYIIESVKSMPFEQYVYNPLLLQLDNQLSAYFPPLDGAVTPPGVPAARGGQKSAADSSQPEEPSSSSGTIEIPLGFNPRPKQKFHSDEIMHGLGKGVVTIVLGIESSSVSEKLARGNFTAYGDPDIFRGSEYDARLPACELCALNYEERGTFVVGLKLLETTTALYLKIKWHAFRTPAALGASEARRDGCLFVKPDTISVAPRETAYFKAIFYNTEETPCNWSVAEENGGTVEPNGIYTAPNKEGVYEVRVQSIPDPSLKASAFVVVKEKGAN